MKKIKLTQNKFALIDDEDFEKISSKKWHAVNTGCNWYASSYAGPSEKNIYMHVFLMNPKKGMEVDHKNGDGLDNQRANLRHANRSQQTINRKKSIGKSSIFKGVFWNTQKNKWQSKIDSKFYKKHLGFFKNEIAAAFRYDLKVRALYGEFARTNFSWEKP